MKKIISLFQRNYDGDRLVRDEVTPGAEWVLAGEGIPTRKWDGTCALYKEGTWFKRYDAKNGKKPPDGFIPAQEADPVTRHQPGWLKVGDGPDDKWFRAAIEVDHLGNPFPWSEGTYELIGPKINGNPEYVSEHEFRRHGTDKLFDLAVGRTFESIKEYLSTREMEGIVWHHPDGRMVKIKKKDFGFKRIK